MSKISVIIAAYNVEEFIAETLKSVTGQTLNDVEIVVVDDCSTDSTPKILAEFAERDQRIRVVRQAVNSGLVRVRQAGLKEATGQYVMFLDGDDKLAINACEKAYAAITAENVDMLQFDVKLNFVPPMRPSKTVVQDQKRARCSPRHKVVSESRAGVLDEGAVGDVISFTIWDKIYKRELLCEAAAYVPDEYLNMAEDVLYSFLVHYHAHSYSYISDELYIYRFGCGMSTTSSLNERIVRSIAKNAYVYNYLDEWAKEMNAESECEPALRRVHKQLYSHITDTYIHCKTKEERDFLISEVLKYGRAEHLIFTLSDYFYNELQGYKNSESYRLGMIITFIPRKIIAFFKKLFGRRSK